MKLMNTTALWALGWVVVAAACSGGEQQAASSDGDDAGPSSGHRDAKAPDGGSPATPPAKDASSTAKDAARPGSDSDESGSGDPPLSNPGGLLPELVVPGDPGQADVTFDVSSEGEGHPISPYIYCLNVGGGNEAIAHLNEFVANARPTLVRSGGNRFSAYNWENNASNAGADWHHQNDAHLSSSSEPGAAVAPVLASGKSAKHGVLLTASLQTYVAADKAPEGDVNPGAAEDTSYLQTRFKKNQAKKGSAFSLEPDTEDEFVYQDEFAAWAKGQAPDVPLFFALDNEPDLWHHTHARIHPPVAMVEENGKLRPVGKGATYDDVVEKNLEFAAAIKEAAPEAQILGYAGFGWSGFRTLLNDADSKTKGEFIDYYLEQIALHQSGKRLIDYMDVHWYPEDRGDPEDSSTRVTGPGTSASEIAARLQAPRSLWDETFVEDTWIGRNLREPVRLVRRMKDKIAAHAPGTKLAIAEWSYGATHHISGGIAAADVLGVFGRDGVDLACEWSMDTGGVFRNAAFEVYRNVDRRGLSFGDTSVTATSSDRESSSVYASTHSQNPADMVIVAINKKDVPRTAALKITHKAEYQSAAVFVLDGKAPHPLPAAPILTAARNAFSYEMPPMSVSIIVPLTRKLTDVPAGWTVPKPPTGYTFDADAAGFAFGNAKPKTLLSDATLEWGDAAGETAGGLQISAPFSDVEQTLEIMAPVDPQKPLDLTGKTVSVKVRLDSGLTSDPTAPGGAFLFAMSGTEYTWVMGNWKGMSSAGNWTTLTFDPVKIKVTNPDFDPADIRALGINLGTGKSGSYSPAKYSLDDFYFHEAP